MLLSFLRQFSWFQIVIIYSKLRVFHTILITLAVFDILNSQTDGRVDRARGATIMTHLECIKAHILELVDNSTDVDLLDLILKLLIRES